MPCSCTSSPLSQTSSIVCILTLPMMSQFQVDIHELCLRGTVRVYCEGLSMLAWNGFAPDALETDICNLNGDDCFV